MPPRPRITVVGAGFTGSMLAVRLLDAPAPASVEVVLIERAGDFGPGLAYGLARSTNLLNVPAGNMSAFDDDPGHFLRWAQAIDPAVRTGDFLSRRLYAEYLRHVLNDAQRRSIGGEASGGGPSAGALVRVTGEVVDVIDNEDGPASVHLADGRHLQCDCVVLCLGNFPPGAGWFPGRKPLPLDVDAGGRVVNDPWAPEALAGLLPGEADAAGDVLLVGTGLTMIDVVTELKSAGHRGTIHAISRRGLMPAPHRSPSKPPPPLTPPTALAAWDGSVRSLVRLMRDAVRAAAARGTDWREVVASVRSSTPALWQRLNHAERSRFLRHVRAYWEVARHRLAPSVATQIDGWRADRSLRILAGRIESVAPHAEDHSANPRLDVTYRPRAAAGGSSPLAAPATLTVARIINCTGPQSDLSLVRGPLVPALLRRGVIRPDLLRLGADCAVDGAAIDASGRPSRRVFVAGPLRKGRLWETTAVPELRVQVSELARRLLREGSVASMRPDQAATPSGADAASSR